MANGSERKTRTPNSSFPTLFFADVFDNPITERQSQTVTINSSVVSIAIGRWLRLLKQRVASSSAIRRRSRHHWSLACFSSFECLEARVCLAAAPTADAGGPYNINAGDIVMLNGTLSTSDNTDPDNPPGAMYYGWILNGIAVTGTPAEVSIPWFPNPFNPSAQSLSGTFGLTKGVTASTYNVALGVADNNGTNATLTTITVAANGDPVPHISSINGVNAGNEIHIRAFDSLNLDGSETTDPDVFGWPTSIPFDTLTFSWDILDDGTVEFSGPPIHSFQSISWDTLKSTYGFAPGGSYPVSLTENDGYVDRTTSVTVFVDNVAPEADAIGFVLTSIAHRNLTNETNKEPPGAVSV